MRVRNALLFGSTLVFGAAIASASGCGINSTSSAGYDTEGGGSAGRGGTAGASGSSAGGVSSGGAAGAVAGGSAGTGGTSDGKACETVDDCDDGNPCTNEACVSKHCASSPVLPGAECDTDNDRCNGIGACDGTVCKPKAGTAPNMDDGDPCTVASCDPATGNVTHISKVKETDNTKCSKAVCDPVTGQVSVVDVDVDDGNACTTDACDLAAGPVHTPVQVGDGDPCTVDKCDQVGGVSHTPIPGCVGCDAATQQEADLKCDDGDPCTKDTCLPPPKPGEKRACASEVVENGTNIDDDGTVCNGIDTCEAGKRVPGTSIDVDDNNKCTDDKCDPKTGEVSHTGVGFDDNNKCTIDTCDPQQGAIHTPVNADDGNACTTNDRCDPNGKGDGLTSDPIPGCTSCKVTNDCAKLNKTCQNFQCDAGQCKQVNLTSDGTCSSQTTTCKSFACNAGSCVGTNAQNGTTCDNDTNKCNGDCVCSSGSPSNSPPKNPDDSKACTSDSCDAATGTISNTPKSGCQPCTVSGSCTTLPSGTDASCVNAACTKGGNAEGECTYSFKSSGTVCGLPSSVCATAPTCDNAGHCGGGSTVADCCLTDIECNLGNTDPKCKPKVCNQTSHKCEEKPVVCPTTCGATAGGLPGVQAQACNPTDGKCVASGGVSGCNTGQICLDVVGCTNCTGNGNLCPDTGKCDNTGVCCAATCAANQDCENAKPGCDLCTCGGSTTCKPNGAANPKVCKQ